MRADTDHSKNFRNVEGDIYARGKRGMFYVHRRIPAAIRLAYPPGKTHITHSLKTACLATARRASRLKVAQIEAEFERKRAEIDLSRAAEAPVRVGRLTDRQLCGALDHWARSVLLADDARRAEGVSDAEFDTLEKDLRQRRAVYGRALAMGQPLPHLEMFTSYLAKCGIRYQGSASEDRHLANQFVARLVKVHDYMLSRLSGEVCPTDEFAPQVPHPMYLIAPERAPTASDVATWDRVFNIWRDAVVNRPKPTTVANMTAWRDLQGFAEANGIVSPADVTTKVMDSFVDDMVSRISSPTAKDRLAMIRRIYAEACRKAVVELNPAANTTAPEQNNAAKRRNKKRLPFNNGELQAVFGSQVYREHRRSEGQSGEATYWIPLIMRYTGARPEEVAGLALADIQRDETLGCYFNILDRYDDEDVDLFDEDPVPMSHRRTLKNGASRRRIPLAQELIDLGLMRYIECVREAGATVLFPTLEKDCLGKLSGAFVKVFSRIKIQELGITDKRKVLYSLRHNMKDLLEQAEVPSKVLKRILGHTSGDGDTTDGYGSDLPFEQIVRHFERVKFPPIPALPWEPGRGGLRLPKKAKAASAEAVVARPGERQAGVTRSRGTLGKRLH